MLKYGYAECAKHGVGSIIPVGSLASLACGRLHGGKCAIRGWVTWFAKELAPLNVRVNGLYPGLVATDMTQRAVDNEQVSAMMLKSIPLGRFGTVEDMASAVLFLASDASSWMTGQHLVVDGGTLCMG